jgi:hypothetical protein
VAVAVENLEAVYRHCLPPNYRSVPNGLIQD